MDKKREKELLDAISIFFELSREDRAMICDDLITAYISRVKAVARARKVAAAT